MSHLNKLYMSILRRSIGGLIPVLLFFSGCDPRVEMKPDLPAEIAFRPPMGWNSYDCFGAAVTEAEVRANAEFMAKHLKEFGWEYIVIDYCWYYPHPPGSIQDNPPQFRLPKDHSLVPWMPMDEYGRLLPDPGKFPSAADGQGFKPLADYIHSLGLKFGIHLMRGIPRQAVWARTPVWDKEGIKADLIADSTSVCPWLNLMYGVDMSAEGAQDYYNSLFELYAEWGVDFVKVDDIDLNERYPYRQQEVEAYRKAIDHCKRPMVLSLSLNLKYEHRDHLKEHADMWRISRDFWDDWPKLKAQFENCALWAGYSGPNSWPDADMLPIGELRLRGPFLPPGPGRFTPDEHYTLLTLWSIARSPLMIGGHLPASDAFVIELLSNPEVIEVNQKSTGGHEWFNENDRIIWKAADPGSEDIYIALFNTGEETTDITLSFRELELPDRVRIRNLWERKDLGLFVHSSTFPVNPHGALLLKLQHEQTPGDTTLFRR